MNREHTVTEAEFKEIIERLSSGESSIKSAHHRIDDVEKKQDDLADLVSSVKILADREARVEEDVVEIKTDVKELKEKPTKRYETFVTALLTGLGTGVVGYLLALILH